MVKSIRRFLPFLIALAVVIPVVAQNGYIKAVGEPGRAGVFVDGRYLGPAERFTVSEKYAVAPGEYQVSIRDPRFEEYTTTVTVREDQTTKIKYKLKRLEPAQPPYGTLRFTGGSPDSFMSVVGGDISPVYVNDRFWGYVDEFNNPSTGMLLPPGTYEVRVDSPMYGQINETVTIEANRVTTIPLQYYTSAHK